MNSSDLIYAYPIALKLENDEELSEAFVTFDEPNLFNEPYDSLGIKLAATGAYLVGLVGSGIQHTWARVKLLAWGYTLEASTFGKGGVGKIFRL